MWKQHQRPARRAPHRSQIWLVQQHRLAARRFAPVASDPAPGIHFHALLFGWQRHLIIPYSTLASCRLPRHLNKNLSTWPLALEHLAKTKLTELLQCAEKLSERLNSLHIFDFDV